ncbi:F-box/LRR-repeat protein 7 [Frankliniella fusca]|uniref:F-box/LRR-repeat protein 7 n=1 Tax=Frankliniella fusca TaxID=407009 RepID=A0AAE1GQA2_9NEOP|nr:F-box/LRR-repeat protein 7 [Frankliniella fusca]
MAEQKSEQADRVAVESRSAPSDLLGVLPELLLPDDAFLEVVAEQESEQADRDLLGDLPLLLLPDDALLEVMQYLHVADLLACRLVCRRLGALALHPQLWGHQRFPNKFSPRERAPVLRLAPRFGLLNLTVPLARPLTFFTTSKCAVETLWLGMRQSTLQAGQEASLVIRKQEALGRLRRLYCRSSPADPDDPAEAAAGEVELLATLASTSQLEQLLVYGSWRGFTPSLVEELRLSPFTEASLKLLRLKDCDPLSLSPAFPAFANHILSTHASTLESVDLNSHPLSALNSDLSTCSILAGMPKLSQLRCAPLSGMDALAECPLLRDVAFELKGESSAAARDAAAKFLRRATQQLVKVELVYNATASTSLKTAVDMVQALAATGKSRVETLSLVHHEYSTGLFGTMDSPRWRQALLQALRSLPALSELAVTSKCHRPGLTGLETFLFLGITPAVAPALRTLKVQPDEVRCAHGALHTEPVQRLLASNPALRLVVLARPCNKKCDWCKVGCHPEMRCDARYPFQKQEITIPRYENVQLSLP